MDTHTPRWQQRFENFEKAYKLLLATSTINKLSEAERAGLIQFFEMAFELSWKLLKDYLVEEGYTIASPREAYKIAFQAGLIADGEVWLRALTDRNLTVHTYDENTANLVETRILTEYLPLLTTLYAAFGSKRG